MIVGPKSLCFFSAALLLAACGGTTDTTNNPGNPATATQPVTLSSSATVIALPAVSTYTESLTLPAGTPVGATLGTTISTTAPTGLPALASLAAPGNPNELRDATTSPTPVAFLQLTNSTSTAEVFGSYPGFSITTVGTATFPSGTYEAEVYDSANPSAGWVVTGTAVLTNPTLTFTGPQGTFTVAPGATATLALVAAQPAGASGVVTLSPATTSAAPFSLTLNGTISVIAVENNYSGAFTAASSNTAVATVQESSLTSFVVKGVAAGSAQITVSDNAGHSATFFVSVAAVNAVGTFTISLPSQQGQAVAIPATTGSNVVSGTVTFATAQTGNPYPANTVVTVTVSNAIPAGFGFTLSGSQQQEFGITFNSNNTITPAMMPALPAMTVSLAQAPSQGQLDGEVLLPLKAFATSCSILGASGTNAWTIGGEGEPQGLSAGVASGYDFFFGNAICLP
jgi:hypothetical protein